MNTQEIIICASERKLLEEIYCRENINNCISAINKKWHKNTTPIPISITAINTAKNAKDDIEVFFTKSIHALPNWKACPLDRCSLDNIPEKAEWLVYFLTHKKGGKDYRLISTEDMFGVWATISATLRTLTWRYEENQFTDPEANARIGMLLAFREAKEMVAQGAGHARKHEEDAQTALAPVMEAFQNRITDTFFPPYTRELPPLPAGIALPVDRVIRLITGER